MAGLGIMIYTILLSTSRYPFIELASSFFRYALGCRIERERGPAVRNTKGGGAIAGRGERGTNSVRSAVGGDSLAAPDGSLQVH